MDVKYEAWETPSDRLKDVVDGLRHADFLGANVTIPHKEAVLTMMDEMENLAREIGAVNTIVNREGKLWGYNTDAQGFLRALRKDGEFDPWGKHVIILGAGGAARAVSVAILRVGARSITIFNRTLERAQKLASTLRLLNAEAYALSWRREGLKEAISRCDLVVNCTSMGMKHSPGEGGTPLEAAIIPRGIVIFDLVYNPIETPLLMEARKAGARPIGGLPMLVYQGAASFELWTGKKAPLDVMFASAKKALHNEKA